MDEVKNILEKIQTKITKPRFNDAITDAIPRTYLLGNGNVGLVSDINSQGKLFHISKSDFWNAGDLKTDCVMGYNKNRIMPLALADIAFESNSFGRFKEECLDLYDATLFTTYSNCTIESYIHSDNRIMFKIRAKKNLKFLVKLSPTPFHNDDFPSGVNESEELPFVYRESLNNATENNNSFKSQVRLFIKSIDVNFNVLNNSSQAEILLSEGKCVDIAVGVFGGGKTYNNNGKLLYKDFNKNIEQFHSFTDIEKSKSEHIKRWHNYWRKSYININDNLLERYYYGSLYIMNSCMRAGSLPPGIMGIWQTDDNVKWNGDYHMNYNYIAPFYGLCSSNRCDIVEDAVNPLLDYFEEGQRRAKHDLEKIFWNRDTLTIEEKYKEKAEQVKNGFDDSLLYPVALGPYGLTAWEDKTGGYWNQVTNLLLSTSVFIGCYLYTLDKTYINKILPLLINGVNFFIQWRDKKVINDTYVYNILSGAHEGEFDTNATGALACVKYTLKALLFAHKREDITLSRTQIEVYKDFLAHLPTFPVGKIQYKKFLIAFNKEILLLSQDGKPYMPQGQSVALEAIHPLECIDFTSSEKMKEICRNTIQLKSLTSFFHWRDVNSLPKTFVAGVRVGYPVKKLIGHFKWILMQDLCYNYTVKDYGNSHGIEKAGAIEFINNMLLQSTNQIIALFPNWNKTKDGEFYNLLAKGNITVSAEFSAKKQQINFAAFSVPYKKQICVKNDFNNPVITNENGEKVLFKSIKVNGINCLAWQANGNTEYILKNT